MKNWDEKDWDKNSVVIKCVLDFSVYEKAKERKRITVCPSVKVPVSKRNESRVISIHILLLISYMHMIFSHMI